MYKLVFNKDLSYLEVIELGQYCNDANRELIESHDSEEEAIASGREILDGSHALINFSNHPYNSAKGIILY